MDSSVGMTESEIQISVAKFNTLVQPWFQFLPNVHADKYTQPSLPRFVGQMHRSHR